MNSKLCTDIVKLIQQGDWVNVERRLNTKTTRPVVRKKNQKRLDDMRSKDHLLLQQQDEKGQLPLHYACSIATKSSLKALKALIESYPESVKHKDVEGATPIHIFCSRTVRSTECAKFIIAQHPAALSARDRFGRTPIFHLVHSHLASYAYEDFPTLLLILALERLLRHEHAFKALTIPCGPDDHHENPRNASYKGPIHSFSNRWEDRSQEEKTPLHMMWTYAIRTNTDHRTGNPVKHNKKKMKVALLFLRCAYLYEVNGTVDFSFKEIPFIDRNTESRLIKGVRTQEGDNGEKDTYLDAPSNINAASNIHSEDDREKLSEFYDTSDMSDRDQPKPDMNRLNEEWNECYARTNAPPESDDEFNLSSGDFNLSNGECNLSNVEIPNHNNFFDNKDTDFSAPTNQRRDARQRWKEANQRRRERREKKDNEKLTKFRIIHAAITLHQWLPCEDILRISLKFCPHQLQTREEKTGFIPLHIAIIKNAGRGIIEKLIKYDKDTAKVRTKSGQLPLHLALAQPSYDMATLKCIFDAYPDAIKERDPGTKLYPFMIPAMSIDERRRLSIKDDAPQAGRTDHLEAVSKAFELLMLCPDIHGLVLKHSSLNS
jgi:hypothetical protein